MGMMRSNKRIRQRNSNEKKYKERIVKKEFQIALNKLKTLMLIAELKIRGIKRIRSIKKSRWKFS